LPAGLACRVLLQRRKKLPGAPPERRRMLKDEYLRSLGQVKAMLILRPNTQLLVVEETVKRKPRRQGFRAVTSGRPDRPYSGPIGAGLPMPQSFRPLRRYRSSTSKST